MEDELTFFFDSYALIEIYEKNKNYEKYSRVSVVTSYFQIYEVYNSLIKNGPKIEIEKKIMEKAKIPLEKMMSIKRGD